MTVFNICKNIPTLDLQIEKKKQVVSSGFPLETTWSVWTQKPKEP